MKRLLFTVVLGGLMMAPSVKGQVNPLHESVTPPEGQFYYGIKVGMNMAKITGFKDVNELSVKPLFGINGGLYAGYMIAENLSVQSELLISRKGVRINGLGNMIISTIQQELKKQNLEEQYGGLAEEFIKGVDPKMSIETTYIDVPVLLQYTFPIGIYLEGGAQLGFLVSSNYKLEGKVVGKSVALKIDAYDDFKKFDFSIVGGVGYRFDRNWNVNLRYTHGLTKVVKGDVKELSGKSPKNSVFQLGVGYTL